MADDSGAQSKLDRIIEQFGFVAGGQWTQTLTKNLAAAAMSRVQQQFRKGVDPNDTAWEPLKIRKGRPLRDKGRLASSFTYTVSGDIFKIGTNLSWVATHQQGATIHAKPGGVLRFPIGMVKAKGAKKKTMKFAFAQSVTIPKRQIMPEGTWSKPWEAAMKEASDVAFEKFWAKLKG